MKITVTQQDIDKGRPGSHVACPLALAIQRVYPRKRIGVSGSLARVGRYSYTLPEVASEFVFRVDRHQGVKPFEFDLPLD